MIGDREADRTKWTAPITARTTPPQDAHDLIIVTTKSHHTLQALQARETVVATGMMIIPLQNGVGNVGHLRAVLPAVVDADLALVGLQIVGTAVVDRRRARAPHHR